MEDYTTVVNSIIHRDAVTGSLMGPNRFHSAHQEQGRGVAEPL